MGDRAARLDVTLLLFELGHLRARCLELFVLGVEPPLEQLILLGIGPLVGGFGDDGCEEGRLPERGDFSGAELSLIESQVLQAQPGDRLGIISLTDFERDGRLDRALEGVGFDICLLSHSIDVNLHPRCGLRPVVGHSHVGPFIPLHLSFGDDLERIPAPVVDDVRSDPSALDPEVPAAIPIRSVHAGGDRALAVVGLEIDPGGE